MCSMFSVSFKFWLPEDWSRVEQQRTVAKKKKKKKKKKREKKGKLDKDRAKD